MDKKHDESDIILKLELLTDKALCFAEKKELYNVTRYLDKRRAVLDSIKSFKHINSDIDSTSAGIKRLLTKDSQLRDILSKNKSETEKQKLQFDEMKKLRLRFSGKPAIKSRFFDQQV